MDMTKFRESHMCGYTHAGICISCRRGRENCLGGRFRNTCKNYLDNTPTIEEYVEQYAILIRKLFAAEGEPTRGDIYGAAQSKRKFLRVWIEVNEEMLRAAEDAAFVAGEENERDLRRLRWEL